MTDYTPTTPQIKGSYVQLHSGTSWVSKRLRRAEFDRWLDEIRAEAWDKGAETAWNRSTPEVNGARYYWRHEGEPFNPYRQEKDA